MTPTPIPATEYLLLVRDCAVYALLWLALLSPWLLLLRGGRQADEAALGWDRGRMERLRQYESSTLIGDSQCRP